MPGGARSSLPRAGGAAVAALRWLDHRFDAAFGSVHNPLRQLGALGFLFLWLLVVSGVYLYTVIDTSASGAYPSIDRLARDAWGLGGVLRSVHRYAADGFVVVMLLHLAREWLAGHSHGFRAFSWWTGVPLTAFAFVCAVGGFWLNWDQLGQYSAVASAEWLDALPFFGSPMTRNFLQPGAVSDRLFSLFIFIHLGVPLLLVFGLWFHVQRISRAAILPSRPLALGSVMVLIALALAVPVRSHAPADLGVVPGTLALDWLLLFIHPLADATSATTVWWFVGAAFALLIGWPMLPRRAARAPVARVDPANCNGCRRCFDDCPYAAVTMVPHPNQRVGRQLAQVNADLCASCGICVGACPSSTPFRGRGSAAELVTGIDMPSAPIGALRRRLQHGLAQLRGPERIVVFGCDRGARVETLAGPDVLPLSLMCIGVLPPSFIEYALRDGASAVLVSGCRAGGCEFRHGQRWTEQRLAGTREPHLRAQVPRERVATCWADAGDEDELRARVQQLRLTSARDMGTGTPSSTATAAVATTAATATAEVAPPEAISRARGDAP
jgi:coenzyme F420-reducing hydrogenase delta subunit/ferredoxin